MIAYLLRDIPADLWQQVKAQAAGEGHSVRYVLLVLLRVYVVLGRLPAVSQEDDT